MFFVVWTHTEIGSVVISWECFECELCLPGWLWRNMICVLSLAKNHWHLCMQDECIRHDSCLNFLCKFRHRCLSRKVSNVTITSPVSTVSAWNALDHDPPFGDQERLAFYSLGFATEARVIKKALTMYYSVIKHDRHLRTQEKYRYFYFFLPLSVIWF